MVYLYLFLLILPESLCSNGSLPNQVEKEKGIIHELRGSHPGVVISNNQQNLFDFISKQNIFV